MKEKAFFLSLCLMALIIQASSLTYNLGNDGPVILAYQYDNRSNVREGECTANVFNAENKALIAANRAIKRHSDGLYYMDRKGLDKGLYTIELTCNQPTALKADKASFDLQVENAVPQGLIAGLTESSTDDTSEGTSGAVDDGILDALVSFLGGVLQGIIDIKDMILDWFSTIADALKFIWDLLTLVFVWGAVLLVVFLVFVELVLIILAYTRTGDAFEAMVSLFMYNYTVLSYIANVLLILGNWALGKVFDLLQIVASAVPL
jgi:hypothetical protein